MKSKPTLLALALGLAAILTLALLELGSLVLIEMGWIHAPVPSYSLERASSLNRQQSFWADLDPVFGVWHRPDSTLHHTKSCFDVHYRANAHGQRDRPRTLEGAPDRVVLLGDSMTEGFGVTRDDRFSDRLEASTGREILNFGTSGDFGPTQYHLLYRTFASRFSHDTVLIGLFPANDFRDDDIEFGRRIYADRYRPYWVGTPPNWQLTYLRESLTADVDLPDEPVSWRRLASEFSYAYSALRYTRRLMRQSDATSGSAFYEYSEAELARMLHSLRLIREDAGERRVVLALLPSEVDFLRFAEVGPSPLAQSLVSFGQAHDIEVVDLLEILSATLEDPTDPSRFFLSCDGHWNGEGHAAAANALHAHLAR